MIWRQAQKPLALYLRGSAANRNRKHEPWDIDFMLVSTKYQQKIALEQLPFNAGIVDLTIVHPEELARDLFISKKLEQALLLYGSEMREMVNISITDEIRKDYVTEQVERLLNKLTLFNNEMDEQEYEARIASYTKGVLRLGGLFYLTKQEPLIRDPIACGELLKKRFPELTLNIAYLQRHFGEWSKINPDLLKDLLVEMRCQI